jgi:hypothetical protein
MMPCRYCGPKAKDGLRQVGRTVRSGTAFVRNYECLDCRATMRCEGDLGDPFGIKEEWRPTRFACALRRRRDGTYYWKMSLIGRVRSALPAGSASLPRRRVSGLVSS